MGDRDMGVIKFNRAKLYGCQPVQSFRTLDHLVTNLSKVYDGHFREFVRIKLQYWFLIVMGMICLKARQSVKYQHRWHMP
jgi:hypothetical protein